MTEEKKFDLSHLAPDRSGIICEMFGDEAFTLRLYDLGIIEGTKITALYKSPSGDPVAYLVRGTVIALRNDDARKIIVLNTSD